MAGISATLTGIVLDKLQAPADGINVRLQAMAEADPSVTVRPISRMSALNASVDLAEKAGKAYYPAIFVYCDRVSNAQAEKFRTFSGKGRVVIDIRHSEDVLEVVEPQLARYTDAACALLEDSRGDWGSGAFYSGGYELSYDPVAKGGKNFLQRAKISFEVEVSK